MSFICSELCFPFLSPARSSGGLYCVKGIVMVRYLRLRAVDSLKSKLPQIQVTEEGEARTITANFL